MLEKGALAFMKSQEHKWDFRVSSHLLIIQHIGDYHLIFKTKILNAVIETHTVKPLIACQGCSNYIFSLDLTPGFNGLGKDSCDVRWESFKCWDLVWLILEFSWYFAFLLKFHWSACRDRIGNMSAWVQVMDQHQIGDKHLPEAMII